MRIRENYKSLKLTNTKAVIFKDENEKMISSVLCYTFFLIEIESIFPPTDCIFTFRFFTSQSNEVRTISVYSMEIRKEFIFENGLYILYLNQVKEFREALPKDLIPVDFKFTNKRDTNSLARLFYKIAQV